MKEAFGRLIRWTDAWKGSGVPFSAAQLSANRSGELASEQLPPFGWQLLGLCVLGVLLFFVGRWGSSLDPELWPLAPRPMCPAWMPYVHFPRSAQTGLPIPSFDRDRIDLRSLPEVQERQLRVDALAQGAPVERRIDMGCAQAATPGMRFGEVTPGEAVEIQNVHPELPNWQWRLPLERPRMACRIPHQRAEEMDAKMRLLFIQPERDLLGIVWVGERRLQAQFTQEQLVRADFGMKWTG